jgi:hypothetical protein
VAAAPTTVLPQGWLARRAALSKCVREKSVELGVSIQKLEKSLVEVAQCEDEEVQLPLDEAGCDERLSVAKAALAATFDRFCTIAKIKDLIWGWGITKVLIKSPIYFFM